MVSPVPKHLRADAEASCIPRQLRDHVCDLIVHPSNGVRVPGAGQHRAKFAPGLATELLKLAGTTSVGDPMCGVGTLCWDSGAAPMCLNDIDPKMVEFLAPLEARGSAISYLPADEIVWSREVCIFSPPYYPRTDRRIPNAHNDARRGPVVGFRDSYSADHPKLIGNPGGVDAILRYREQMRLVYAHLRRRCARMIVVTKNWMRLGTELRLDLDTILTAQEAGWSCVERHGWEPSPSLWARFNEARGVDQGRSGAVTVEDVLIFE